MRRIAASCVWAAAALAAGATVPVRAETDAPEAARPPDPALLARVVEAAGGADALATLRGFRARGRILPLVDGPSASVRVSLDLGGSLREDVREPGRASSQRLVGRLAWRGGRKPEPATGAAAEEIRRRYRVLAAPFDLARTPADSLRDGGATAEGWVRILRRGVDGSLVAWDVEPASGRVRRFAELAPNPPGGSAAETEFDDYRMADGLAWPFRATTYVDGHPVRETIWERFERADDLRADEFLPPGTGGGL